MHISHFSEDDLSNFVELKADNSCQWILNVPSYQQWFNIAGREREVFWLSGEPGSGKTVIAAHLATHLQTSGFDVCYYFFKEGHKDQQTISGLLRQIAYQMADKHMDVRRRLAQMQENSITFDKDDERAIWRKVFVNELLKAPLANQQVWVIDGLDECRDSEKLFSMLSKIDSAFPLSIFISSRRLPPLEKHFTALKSRLFNHHIVPRDTLVDIRTYIEAACDEMELEGNHRNEVVQLMTQKSEGSFLWTKLAFEKLDQTFTFGEDGMMEALREIPSGMLDLYEQVLQTMCGTRSMSLTKAILAWVVCANRKMKAPELQAAIEFDLGKSIFNIEKTVDVLCGQLIRVEKTGSVQLIHTTARDFLLRPDLDSELAVRRSETHERLAIVCLNYLCSNQMQPPRSRDLMTELKDINSDFADYAITAWSDHVAGASSRNGRLMSLVCKFLRTNVLTWFEYIARRKKNLYHITRTARNLRNYLDRRTKHSAPLGDEYLFIDQWTMDMLRVAAKFGRSLLLYPSTIYFIIPPLCPYKSSIYQQFGSSDGLLTISGFADEFWDDCISYIEHRDTRAMSLAGADNMFAIGLKSGYVKLYHKTTCQDRVSFYHGEPVKVLKFDNASQRLATSGNRKFKLWTIDGELIWERTHTDPPVTLVFSQEDDIIVAGTKASCVASWRCVDGENAPIHPENSDNQNGVRKFASRQAILSSSISPDLKAMVIAYRGRSPEIWSLEKGIRLGKFEKATLSIFQVMFNPNPNIDLLAFSYQDGEMSIFNPWTQKELATVQGEGYTLAATPDGRTLATGDMLGTIKIWDFETLHLLYAIKSPDYEIRQLAFSGDGLRLFDIRDSKSKVWEPAALVRKSINDDSSVSDSAHEHEMAPALTVGSYGITVAITVMLAPPDVDCIFVGKDDGSVCCYDKRTGKHISKLYSHRLDVLPTVIRWNSTKSLLATLDASSTIQIWRLENISSALGSGWQAVENVLLVKRGSPVRDIHFTPDGTHLLIRGTLTDTICPIFETMSEEDCTRLPFPDDSDRLASHWMWYKVGIDDHRLLLATRNGRIWLYRQESPQAHNILENPVQLVNHKGQEDLPLIKRMTLDSSAAFLVIEFEEDSTKGPSSPKIFAYNMGDVLNSGKLEGDVPAKPVLYLAVADAKSWLGFYGSQAVFLDTTLWVRSLNIRKHASSGIIGGINDAYLYFFIPYELIGGNNGVDGTVTEQGNVVFPREGELGVVCNALSYSFDI